MATPGLSPHLLKLCPLHAATASTAELRPEAYLRVVFFVFVVSLVVCRWCCDAVQELVVVIVEAVIK